MPLVPTAFISSSESEPVMVADAPYETGGGVEDPRLVKIGDTFYLTYTGYNKLGGSGMHANGPLHGDAQLCLATSTDLIHWGRKGRYHACV